MDERIDLLEAYRWDNIQRRLEAWHKAWAAVDAREAELGDWPNVLDPVWEQVRKAEGDAVDDIEFLVKVVKRLLTVSAEGCESNIHGKRGSDCSDCATYRWLGNIGITKEQA